MYNPSLPLYIIITIRFFHLRHDSIRLSTSPTRQEPRLLSRPSTGCFRLGVRRADGGKLKEEVDMTVRHQVWLTDALIGLSLLLGIYLMLLAFSTALLP
jgi:hypothetical protein